MPSIMLDTSKVVDWVSFHAMFASAMGFPPYYGRNMDAWIDCMSSLAEKSPLANIHLGHGEQLAIVLPQFERFSKRLPAVARELLNCTAIVNRRYAELGDSRRVVLVLE